MAFNQDIADIICARLAGGESLRAICRDEGMPANPTVCLWVRERPEFAEQYARARDIGLDVLAEEILEIADDGTNDFMKRQLGEGVEVETLNSEHIQRSKLRVDARKWYLSKLAPKKYGERLDHSHSGNVNLNHTVSFVDPDAPDEK